MLIFGPGQPAAWCFLHLSTSASSRKRLSRDRDRVDARPRRSDVSAGCANQDGDDSLGHQYSSSIGWAREDESLPALDVGLVRCPWEWPAAREPRIRNEGEKSSHPVFPPGPLPSQLQGRRSKVSPRRSPRGKQGASHRPPRLALRAAVSALLEPCRWGVYATCSRLRAGTRSGRACLSLLDTSPAVGETRDGDTKQSGTCDGTNCRIPLPATPDPGAVSV